MIWHALWLCKTWDYDKVVSEKWNILVTSDQADFVKIKKWKADIMDDALNTYN